MRLQGPVLGASWRCEYLLPRWYLVIQRDSIVAVDSR